LLFLTLYLHTINVAFIAQPFAPIRLSICMYVACLSVVCLVALTLGCVRMFVCLSVYLSAIFLLVCLLSSTSLFYMLLSHLTLLRFTQ